MKIPTEEVLAWLLEQHPDLYALAEVDRHWVWITGDTLKPCFKGCACDACQAKATKRKAIGQYGFRFAKRGHPLPSGEMGSWSHSCIAPKPFTRNRKQQTTNEPIIDDTDPAVIAAKALLGL
ncbi:MAG: hypothetical protein AB1705_23665 [Verrucomicrobiota bacterium]